MSITRLMRSMSLIDIAVIWLLNLVYLLMRIIASFLRYTGYPNFIKDPISHVFFASFSSRTSTEFSIILTTCLTAIKNHVIIYLKLFLSEIVKIYFGLLKAQVRFLTN